MEQLAKEAELTADFACQSVAIHLVRAGYGWRRHGSVLECDAWLDIEKDLKRVPGESSCP